MVLYNLGKSLAGPKVALLMRIVAPDQTYVDYFEEVYVIRKGLTNRFGLRVRDGGCTRIIQIGQGQPFIFGTSYALPVDLATLPSTARMVVENHVSNCPDSDLVDVLTGKKSLREAIGLPAKVEVARTRSADGGSTL
jgi:hypothetical protein